MSLLSPDGASPAMAQWFALKAAHPDALLLFRMGDFYELFFADAEAAAAALDIALTARGRHAGAAIPMCGVPVAAASAYVSRLIRRGYRLAVAEQTEKPRPGQKGPLARAVVRLITAGTLTEDDLLEAGRPNLLLALATPPSGRKLGADWPMLGAAWPMLGAAWIDISTGLFETACLERRALGELLGRLDPAEILAAADLALGDHEARRAPPASPSPPLAARTRLAEAFGAASLDAFGSFSDAEAMAAALALDYVRRTQAGAMPRLSRPAPQADRATLGMDAATRASLDLLRARDGGETHTLLSAVNHTLTAPGSRMLATWIAAPLTDAAAIAERQQGWAWLAGAAGRVPRVRFGQRCAACRTWNAPSAGSRSAAGSRATSRRCATACSARARRWSALGTGQQPGFDRAHRRGVSTRVATCGTCSPGRSPPTCRRGSRMAAPLPAAMTANSMPNGACATTAGA